MRTAFAVLLVLAVGRILFPSSPDTAPLPPEPAATQPPASLPEPVTVASIRPPQEAVKPARKKPAVKNTEGTAFRERFFSLQPDPALGEQVLEIMKSQNPYGGLYLMVNGADGRILAWAEQQDHAPLPEPSDLANSRFPAASLSKIITAAAALESNRYSNSSRIPAIGSSVTLYRKQLMVPENYRGKTITLESAFASSVNPSMAIVGQNLGRMRLVDTAEMLGFNREYPEGIPGRSCYLPADQEFGIAEAASGFTNDITLSPLLAAAIVRSILKGDSPEIPWSPLLENRFAPAEPLKLPATPFDENTYLGLRQMFEATVEKGSARRPFRNRRIFSPGNRSRLDVGGKTGTKDDDTVQYQWFAGYARDKAEPEKSLVIVCLHMNELKGMRASYPAQAAALLINQWAKNYLVR